jgi:WhiB family redox-sensing transcriptional regulator
MTVHYERTRMPSQWAGSTRQGPKAGFTASPGAGDGDWRSWAACREEDPELFFPVGNTGAALAQAEDAKWVCRQLCPVQSECLRWALETGQAAGVWGGLSEDDRRTLNRQRPRGEREVA